MAKAKGTATKKAAPKTSKATLPPVDEAGDDLGLGAGLDLEADTAPQTEELTAVLEEGAAAEQESVVVEVDTDSPAFKQAVAAQIAEMRKSEPEHEPVIDVDLSATGPHSKEAKIAIMIDEVDEMSNFEVVGVNGKVYQIKRGEKTLVPLAVVKVLENAIKTTVVQTTDKFTGELISTERDSSSIPWRRV